MSSSTFTSPTAFPLVKISRTSTCRIAWCVWCASSCNHSYATRSSMCMICLSKCKHFASNLAESKKQHHSFGCWRHWNKDPDEWFDEMRSMYNNWKKENEVIVSLGRSGVVCVACLKCTLIIRDFNMAKTAWQKIGRKYHCGSHKVYRYTIAVHIYQKQHKIHVVKHQDTNQPTNHNAVHWIWFASKDSMVLYFGWGLLLAELAACHAYWRVRLQEWQLGDTLWEWNIKKTSETILKPDIYRHNMSRILSIHIFWIRTLKQHM